MDRNMVYAGVAALLAGVGLYAVYQNGKNASTSAAAEQSAAASLANQGSVYAPSTSTTTISEYSPSYTPSTTTTTSPTNNTVTTNNLSNSPKQSPPTNTNGGASSSRIGTPTAASLIKGELQLATGVGIATSAKSIFNLP